MKHSAAPLQVSKPSDTRASDELVRVRFGGREGVFDSIAVQPHSSRRGVLAMVAALDISRRAALILFDILFLLWTLATTN